MSNAPQNRYKADLRDFSFVLFEQFKLGEILGHGPFEGMTEDDVKMVLAGGYEFAQKVTGPINAIGDQGCRVENGRVKTPEGFKEAWKKLYEGGWRSVAVDTEFGGQGMPKSVALLVEEMLSGSNPAFNMYPGLAFGAAEVIAHCGTPAQQALFAHRMFGGEWGGTMCLTEPHAGTDVGSARTTAKPLPGGGYAITGTKIFISGGDHDMADNVVHLVLARLEGAAPGTKGLSLFIVPARRVAADGTLGESNDVTLGGIEHKMGINGSATCVLNFGESGQCIGELVGTTPNVGMSQMFLMMNGARIAVGIQGVAAASAAYLLALDYAKERKQGSNITHFKDPTAPRAAIIEHADVRRMLLSMKARVEGIRALALKLAVHVDRAHSLSGKDDEAVAYHRGQVDLLTPMLKAYGSDQAYRVCEDAIQTLGGAGYIKDYGIEQYARDSKIFSIYEGTNHIQAMDFVARKLPMQGGQHVQRLFADIQSFVAANQGNQAISHEIGTLAKAQEALMAASMKLMGWFQGGKMNLVPLNANRFLEMVSETVVAWMLLDQAAIASAAITKVATDHPDHAFYEGKIAAARFYARNVLPLVQVKLELLTEEDDSPLAISDAAFATV